MFLKIIGAVVLAVCGITAVVAAKGQPEIVTRHGGVIGTLYCLAGWGACKPNQIEIERQILTKIVSDAIHGRVAWDDFQVHISWVEHRTNGNYYAMGSIVGRSSMPLVVRRAEPLVAYLDHNCQTFPSCWHVRELTISGRGIELNRIAGY